MNERNEKKDMEKVSKRGSKSKNRNNTRTRRAGGKNSNTTTNNGISNGSSQLSLDVTRFPFSGALGRKLDIWNSHEQHGNIVQTPSRDYIPGICAISLAPSIGYTAQYNDPINLAARNLYAFVTHANSRNASYEANDLMIYILSVSELFKMWQVGARAYGVARNYTPLNRYTPDKLLMAMGFNPDSVATNLNDMRAQLNLLASKISSLVVPSSIAYITREFTLFSQMYTDDANSRAQMYLFKPSGYWKYNETLTQQGGGLEYASWDTLFTVDEYISIMNTMANAILSSQYMNIMAADIIKAFGDNLYALSEVPADYQIIPVYDQDMLEVISNVTIVGALDEGFHKVEQIIPSDTNLSPYLSHTPMSTSVASDAEMNGKYMYTVMKTRLNTKNEELTPVETVDRTAFSPHMVYVDDLHMRIFGRTELPTKVDFYDMEGKTTVQSPVITADMWKGVPLEQICSVMSQFDWAPILPTMYKDSAGKYEFSGFFGDVCNLSLISKNDMNALNEAVLQMLFSKTN